MRRAERLAAIEALTPRLVEQYVPHVQHPPQQAFLLLGHVPEILYGGAAGGGKSDALLMAALQYVDVPGYSALIIRRTFADLSLPGAIMDRAGQWLRGTDAKPKGTRTWEFPTSDAARPARLTFGYLQHHKDVYQYQGAEFQAIFVDELTQHEERTYQYLFSRLRGPALPCVNCGHATSQPAGQERAHDEGHDECRTCTHAHNDGPDRECPQCGCSDYVPAECRCREATPDRDAKDETGELIVPRAADGTTLADVPLRMRAGSNPGGVGHDWVKARFVSAKTRVPTSVFVPAKLDDNPSVDRRAYRAALSHLDPIERMRLEAGDWDVAEAGDVFRRDWFSIVDEPPANCRWVRYWDLAATAPKKGKDPDWTVGALVGLSREGQWFVADVVRLRGTPFEVERTIAQTAATDGRRVPVRIEQEGGASGVGTIDGYRRRVLVGYDFDGHKPRDDKRTRAKPVASAAQAGNVMLISAPWNRAYLDEFTSFPGGSHDDQVDATSGAFDVMGQRRARIIAWAMATTLCGWLAATSRADRGRRRRRSAARAAGTAVSRSPSVRRWPRSPPSSAPLEAWGWLVPVSAERAGSRLSRVWLVLPGRRPSSSSTGTRPARCGAREAWSSRFWPAMSSTRLIASAPPTMSGPRCAAATRSTDESPAPRCATCGARTTSTCRLPIGPRALAR